MADKLWGESDQHFDLAMLLMDIHGDVKVIKSQTADLREEVKDLTTAVDVVDNRVNILEDWRQRVLSVMSATGKVIAASGAIGTAGFLVAYLLT